MRSPLVLRRPVRRPSYFPARGHSAGISDEALLPVTARPSSPCLYDLRARNKIALPAVFLSRRPGESAVMEYGFGRAFRGPEAIQPSVATTVMAQSISW